MDVLERIFVLSAGDILRCVGSTWKDHFVFCLARSIFPHIFHDAFRAVIRPPWRRHTSDPITTKNCRQLALPPESAINNHS